MRPLVMSFLRGTRLEIHPHEGLTGAWYVVLPEYDEQMFLIRYLRADDLFFDVGSNAGMFSVLAVSCGARAVAFEPVPRTFSRLEQNVRLNVHAGKVLAVQAAVGAEEGSACMTTGLGTGNHILENADMGGSVVVKVVTLNRMASEYGHPSFVKIDVEGHESQVIRGMADVLQSSVLQGLLIETFRAHNWKTSGLVELESTLKTHGFLPYEYEPAGNRLIMLQRPADGRRENTLYLKDPDAVQRRLDTAAVSAWPS